MSRYSGEADYRHGSETSLGVLLVNLGSPDAPTVPAVRRYLAEFLWDPRVVELPRPLWWLALHLLILRFRPARAAHAYAKIWMDEGSPLIVMSKRQRQALESLLRQKVPGPVHVALAMRYGNPSIESGLNELRQAGARRMLILPLYPQYAASSSGTVFDAVTSVFRKWRWVPETRFLMSYHADPGYIQAVAARIEEYWQANARGQLLLFSFHGVPKKMLLAGDPYHCQCCVTARLVAQALGLEEDQWKVTFQSRFGREEWLQPYTDKVLGRLPGDGVKNVDVVCPGFSADCLETLEEIDMQNRQVFIAAGGERFTYIPALNDHPVHMEMLGELVLKHAGGWPEIDTDRDENTIRQQAEESHRRALESGAAH